MPCSKKIKKCVSDVMVQGKSKDSAWAVCRSSIKSEVKRKLKKK